MWKQIYNKRLYYKTRFILILKDEQQKEDRYKSVNLLNMANIFSIIQHAFETIYISSKKILQTFHSIPRQQQS